MKTHGVLASGLTAGLVALAACPSAGRAQVLRPPPGAFPTMSADSTAKYVLYSKVTPLGGVTRAADVAFPSAERDIIKPADLLWLADGAGALVDGRIVFERAGRERKRVRVEAV